MAPARHETPAAAGPSKETSTKTPSIYGTRSSKRKAGDFSTNGDSQNASSSPSQKSADASEQKLPPTKKTRRSSSNSIQQPVKTPESSTPEKTESQSPVLPEISEVPELRVDGPSASSAEEGASPAKSVGWDDPVVIPDDADATQVNGPAPRGRGNGRGRGGWRGRGRGAGRGRGGGRGRARGGGRGRGRGRGASAASGHNTPNVASTPLGKGRGVFRGGRGGRGRGRARVDTPLHIRSLYDRKYFLKEQYLAIAQIQRTALIALSEKSLEKLKSDPKYHETLPEHKLVQDKLRQNYERHVANLHTQDLNKKAYLERKLLHELEYQKRKFDVSCPPPL